MVRQTTRARDQWVGVGTLVLPLLAVLLIDESGWRKAYLVLGGFAAIAGGGMALLVEETCRRRNRLSIEVSEGAICSPT
jgi:MFS family permease